MIGRNMIVASGVNASISTILLTPKIVSKSINQLVGEDGVIFFEKIVEWLTKREGEK